MTKAELRTAIKLESRINRTNLDTLVDNMVSDILTDYCNLARYSELLKEGIPLTLVDTQAAYSLPTDYQNLCSVRYGRGPSPTAFREVILQPETVRRTFNNQYPMYYRIVAGPRISLYPNNAILAIDQLFIDYYFDPMSVFVLDADEFPVPRLLSVVKKDAISRVQRFHSSTQEAQITNQDSRGSFIASKSGS